MIVFVFAKQFEYDMFIISISPIIEIVFIENVGDFNARLITVNIERNQYSFMVLIINESDIMFNLIFNNMLDNFNFNNNFGDLSNYTFVNIGTCGGKKINSYFLINKAIKYDRGILRDNIFEERGDKIKTIDYKLDSRLLDKSLFDNISEIKSGNFLVEKRNDNFLYDMETYDFYSICNYRNLRNYFSLRIVSDKFDNADDEEPKDYFYDFNLESETVLMNDNISELKKLKDMKKIIRNCLYYNTELSKFISELIVDEYDYFIDSISDISEDYYYWNRSYLGKKVKRDSSTSRMIEKSKKRIILFAKQNNLKLNESKINS